MSTLFPYILRYLFYGNERKTRKTRKAKFATKRAKITKRSDLGKGARGGSKSDRSSTAFFLLDDDYYSKKCLVTKVGVDTSVKPLNFLQFSSDGVSIFTDASKPA